jgi:hypothetical protein
LVLSVFAGWGAGHCFFIATGRLIRELGIGEHLFNVFVIFQGFN